MDLTRSDLILDGKSLLSEDSEDSSLGDSGWLLSVPPSQAFQKVSPSETPWLLGGADDNATSLLSKTDDPENAIFQTLYFMAKR